MRFAVLIMLTGILALVFWAVVATFFAPAIDYRYDPDLKRYIEVGDGVRRDRGPRLWISGGGFHSRGKPAHSCGGSLREGS